MHGKYKMPKAKIALYLSELTPEEKVNQAHTINNLMANHVAEFPTPKPTLTAYNGAANNVGARLATISIMEQNLETERTLLADDVAKLDDLTTQLASYVENVAAGDAAVMELAGFKLANPPTPIGQLPPPQDLRGQTASIDGVVNLRWKRVRGTKSYFVECATNPNGPWNQIDVTSRASATATGLTSGTKYWFRVRAFGTAGFSGWSDPAQKMAA